MRSTALPIRVLPDGKLEQQDGLDAILRLVSAMANTKAPDPDEARRDGPASPGDVSSDGWLSWFGLLEPFEEAARRPHQDQERLKDAINRALRQLGVQSFAVHSIATGAGTGDGHRSFNLTFVEPGGRMAGSHELVVGRPTGGSQ